ncbi:MAG: hypothetical protein JW969_18270 [Spirochaetales bacterium]|nr:hypothetical protein [Spirochaetales bacterium]
MRITTCILVFMIFSLFSFTVTAVEQNNILIGSVDYSITGSTRENALQDRLTLAEGMEFNNEEELALYLKNQEQILINLRLFDTIEINYELSDSEDGGFIAIVTVVVVDGFPFFGAPFYKYDSNAGHQFGAIVYFYNFMGSLTTLALSGGYKDTFSGDQFRKINWDIKAVLTGLRFLGLDWSFTAEEDYITVEKKEINPTPPPDDIRTLFYTYYNTNLFFTTGIPLIDKLTYSQSPFLNLKYNYSVLVDQDNVLIDSGGELKHPIVVTISDTNSLNYNTIDWVENFRRGFSASIGNTIGFNFVDLSVFSGIGAALQWMEVFGVLNLSAQLRGAYSFNGDEYSAGDGLRGVEDSYLADQFRLYLNTDAKIRLFRWEEVVEVTGGPFFDIGFLRKADGIFEDIQLTAGIEGIVFPLFLKSLYIRGTLGFDLLHLGKFELILSQTLFY